MKTCLAGINHRTAPVAIREKAAVSSRKLGEALLAMKPYISQGIILSTCNRTELYTIGRNNHDEKASLDFFGTRLGIPDDGTGW